MRERRLVLVAFVALWGCGNEEPMPPDGGGTDGPPPGDRYLPLAVGSSWTYQVTPAGGGIPETKVSTVEAFEDVGGSKAGIMAFRVRTEKIDGTTVSWQEDLGDRVVRHREQTFDLGGVQLTDEYYAPAKLRIDETAAHTQLGAAWQDTYTEVINGGAPVAHADNWTVEAVDEAITVLGASYTCLRVHKMSAQVGQVDKTYWFARGIGKVREIGGQTEELMSRSP